MTQIQDLHAQIAQRLFGWRLSADHERWMTLDDDPVLPEDLPDYTTDPTATARVWQWLEQVHGVREISYEYATTQARLTCTVYGWEGLCLMQEGATWSEALCRTALKLAQALEQGEE